MRPAVFLILTSDLCLNFFQMVILPRAFLLAATLLFSMALTADEYIWQLPPGFPPPRVPVDNPMTIQKVELGRHLFYEKRLSVTNSYSCASCHIQEYAFAEPRTTAVGATGELHKRNSMSLTNVAYNRNYTWAEPAIDTLEKQINIPLFNNDPLELGLSGREEKLLAVLMEDGFYRKLFDDAFPEEKQAVTIQNIIYSIASFVRTLISGNSAYDRLVYLDDPTAMSDSARRGMRLFFSDKLKCAECHSGFNFSGPVVYRDSKEPEIVFHDNGLSRTDDKGVYLVSKDSRDEGKFRAPTLRNIAVTAPYMHDGRFKTLDEVIEHYAKGGFASKNKSKLISGFYLTQNERQDVKGFLESLTDKEFLEYELHSIYKSE